MYKMEAIRSYETSVLIRATRRRLPEDDNHHSHRRGNLRSYNLCMFTLLAMSLVVYILCCIGWRVVLCAIMFIAISARYLILYIFICVVASRKLISMFLLFSVISMKL
jgi:hypothetical protein